MRLATLLICATSLVALPAAAEIKGPPVKPGQAQFIPLVPTQAVQKSEPEVSSSNPPAAEASASGTEPEGAGSAAPVAVSPAEVIDLAGDTNRKPVVDLGANQAPWKDDAAATASVLTTEFDPSRVVKIRVGVGAATAIELPSSETVGDVVYGSGLIRQLTKQANVVVIQPQKSGAGSTVHIFGSSGRVYALYIDAIPYDAEVVPQLVVRFVEPEPPAQPAVEQVKGAPGEPANLLAGMVQEAATSDEPVIVPAAAHENPKDFLHAVDAAGRRIELRYTMAGEPGSADIAPDIVYSDGHFTYLYYTAKRWSAVSFPAIFRFASGVDVPIANWEIKDTTIIVKEMGPLTLRLQDQAICVRPDGWSATAPEGAHGRLVQ